MIVYETEKDRETENGRQKNFKIGREKCVF